MIYISLFIIITILTLISGMLNSKKKIGFNILAVILTLMSMFRYGSGTDYFAYMYHYNNNPDNIVKAIDYNSGMNIGYKVLMAISKNFNFTFEVFTLFLAIIVMGLFVITIARNSKYPMLSLLIFYGTYYQIYVNSALRQGIAMAIFVWAFFRFYKKNKTIKYITAILIASLFHYSVLITLLVPVFKIMYDRFFYNLKINIIIFMIGIMGLIFGGENILIKIANSFGILISYQSNGANLLAVLLRIILLFVVLILYKYSEKTKLSQFDRMCIYFYFINTVVFIFVCNMSILSRMTEYFSILDVFIISNIICEIKMKDIKLFSILFVIAIISTVFIKDQYAFLKEGKYYIKEVNKYPYVTIFNKYDIYNYRIIEDVFKPDL